MYAAFQLSKPIVGITEFVKMPDETRIHTISSGNGDTTILLAHGYGYNHIEWNILVEELNRLNYRTIVFDQRGHGKSSIGKEGIGSAAMASDYKNIIDHFKLENCIIVGHSMGGFLLMKFLLNNPEMQHKQIKSCVLIATFAGNVNKKSFQNRLQIPMIKSGILQKLVKWKPFGNLFVKSILGENPDPEVIRVFLEIFLAQDHSKLVPIMKAFAAEDHYDNLKNITIPCAIMIGDRDTTTPKFHTDDIVEKNTKYHQNRSKGKRTLLEL